MKGDLAYTSLETTWLTSSSCTIKLVRTECPSLLEWCALFSEQLDLITRLRFIFKKERRRREGGGENEYSCPFFPLTGVLLQLKPLAFTSTKQPCFPLSLISACKVIVQNTQSSGRKDLSPALNPSHRHCQWGSMALKPFLGHSTNSNSVDKAAGLNFVTNCTLLSSSKHGENTACPIWLFDC